MSAFFLAQVAAWGLVQWAIAIIVMMGVAAIVAVVLRQMGWQVPPFVVTILWIVFAIFVGIIAIKFLVQIAGVG